MNKVSLTLAISLSLGVGSVEAGGPGAFTSIDVPTSRLIIKTEQTLASPNIMSFTNNLMADSGVEMSFVRSLAVEGSYLYEIPNVARGAELKTIIKELQAIDGVVDVEEDIMLQRMSVNDPRYSSQWHYFESTGGINLEDAWEKTTGAGVYVAVIDTGIIYHEDLTANIIGGYDFISDTDVSNDGNGRDSDPTDPGDWIAANECYWGNSAMDSSWHGTHVAGTIAAVTDNSLGVAGIAYDAKIVPVRVLGKCGGYLSDISDAIVWASGGSVSGVSSNPYPADVINMSLGGSGSCSGTYQSAVNQAVANGTTVVVAAGNSNDNVSGYVPASCSNVISVASNDRSGNRAYYSNYGSLVDVSAPGGETNSTTSNGVLSTLSTGTRSEGSDTYSYYQGTSMAAPHVAGVAALMKSAAPSATPAQIESVLKSTARSLPGSCSGGCGAGIIDAGEAVAVISGDSDGDPDDGDTSGSMTESNLSASTGNTLSYQIEIPAGASLLSVSISGNDSDADLYVRYGSAPTTSRYDCRPYLSSSNESCSFSSPASGTWYINVRAYSSFSGVTLTATWQ